MSEVQVIQPSLGSHAFQKVVDIRVSDICLGASPTSSTGVGRRGSERHSLECRGAHGVRNSSANLIRTRKVLLLARP
jgi:hypothetical protein